MWNGESLWELEGDYHSQGLIVDIGEHQLDAYFIRVALSPCLPPISARGDVEDALGGIDSFQASIVATLSGEDAPSPGGNGVLSSQADETGLVLKFAPATSHTACDKLEYAVYYRIQSEDGLPTLPQANMSTVTDVLTYGEYVHVDKKKSQWEKLGCSSTLTTGIYPESTDKAVDFLIYINVLVRDGENVVAAYTMTTGTIDDTAYVDGVNGFWLSMMLYIFIPLLTMACIAISVSLWMSHRTRPDLIVPPTDGGESGDGEYAALSGEGGSSSRAALPGTNIRRPKKKKKKKGASTGTYGGVDGGDGEEVRSSPFVGL